jgi:hypothetical protein
MDSEKSVGHGVLSFLLVATEVEGEAQSGELVASNKQPEPRRIA